MAFLPYVEDGTLLVYCATTEKSLLRIEQRFCYRERASMCSSRWKADALGTCCIAPWLM